MDLLWFAFAFIAGLVFLTLFSHERQRRLDVREIEAANAAQANAATTAPEAPQAAETPSAPAPQRKAA